MKTLKFLSQIFCLAALLSAVVSCDNDDPSSSPYLTVEEGLNLQFGFDDTAEKSIVIKSNIAWTIEKPAECDWVTLSATKGENDGTVKVTVSENIDKEGRNVNLTISPSDSGVMPVEIKVSQTEKGLASLSVDKTDIWIDSAGARSETLKITSKQSWVVSVPEDAAKWLTLSAAEGEGDMEITVSANKNASSKQRIAILSVAPADGTFAPVEVTVTQDGDQYFNVLTAIRDMNFRTFCMRYDSDNNGILSEKEASTVSLMYVDELGIETLEGIEYFTGLKTFTCTKNHLTELDFSYNTKLVSLDCSQNELTELNVSACADLEILMAGNNYLTTIDISSNTKLKSLSLQYNDMKGLDIEKNTKLIDLALKNCNLTKLDVSNNPELTNLFLDENQFTALNLTNLPKLQRLYCTASQLTELDVTKNTDLRVLSAPGNQIASIDISKNPLLTDLWISYNPLTELDLSKNPLITSFQCLSTKVSVLDLTPCPDMVQIICNNNDKLTELDISTCTKLQSLSCHDCPLLTTIYVWQTFTGPMMWPMPWTYPTGVNWVKK